MWAEQCSVLSSHFSCKLNFTTHSFVATVVRKQYISGTLEQTLKNNFLPNTYNIKGSLNSKLYFSYFLKSKRILMIYVWECAINTQHSCVITHISVFKSIPVDKTTITVHLKVELTRHTNCVICAGEPLACCICNMCSRFFTARPISVTDICAVQLPLSSFSSFSPLSIFLG